MNKQLRKKNNLLTLTDKYMKRKDKKKTKKLEKKIKKLIKINDTIIVMIIIRTMDIVTNSKPTQYRKKHNK